MDADPRLVEALKAHRRGWALTPLDGKRPILSNWTRMPPPTEEDIRKWVAAGRGIGLRTGRVSGVVAIDDDTKDSSGTKALDLPSTVTVVTGSRKRHYYFLAPGVPIGNSASKLHDRVDVRGDGGQVVFVGSIHSETGQPYRWLEGHAPDEIEMAELPARIVNRLTGGEQGRNGHARPDAGPAPAPTPPPANCPPELQRYVQGALRRSVAKVATAAERQRNDTLNKAAFNLGKFVGTGLLDQATVQEKLLIAATAVGLSEREARATIASGLKAGSGDPLDVQELLWKARQRDEGLRSRDPGRASSAQATERPRQQISVVGGKLPEIVDIAEDVLISCDGQPIYQRGSILVRTHRAETDSLATEAIRRKKGALVIRPIDPLYLTEVLTRQADWIKFDKRSKEYLAIDCPEKVAVTYMARVGNWRLPVLRGVIGAPTIRPDGSVLAVDGYDHATGLLLDSGDVVFGPFLARPSLDAARKALAELHFVLKDFPFVAPCDRATVLAAILTALVRRSIRSSPLFAFRAPVMSSGKSLLADIVALIATGREACMMAQGKDEEEIRKRILAILIQGDPIACVDNVTHPLESAALCSVLTQEWYQDRLLGSSQMVRVPTSVLWLATGNNMVFEGDLITRVLPCDLEPGCEHPETRKFDVNLREYIPERRGKLATSALTVLTAYQRAGCPNQGLPVFGRYEEWSKWVRSALVWCGEADPCEGRARLEDIDPVTRRLRAVLQAWHARLASSPVTAAEAIAKANPELRHALLEVAPGQGGQPDARQLGTWLFGHQRRIDLGLRLERAGARSGSALWMVSRAGAVGPVGPVGPSNPTRGESQTANQGVMGETLPQVPPVPRPAKPPRAGSPGNGERDGLGADEGVL